MALFSKDKILVPVDFSEKSLDALKETIEFADTLSNIYVVYVLKPLEATAPGVIWESVNTENRTETIQKLFDNYFPKSKYEALNFSIQQGDPAAEIVDFAEAEKMTLIVMPSRGRTGLSRFFMGSVAENVVRCAHCPVIVLRS